MLSEVSLKELIDVAADHDTRKTDFKANQADIQATPDGQITFDTGLFGSVRMGLEPLAVDHLSARLGKPFWGDSRGLPAPFMRQLYATRPAQWQQVVQPLINDLDVQYLLLRAYGDNLRAILSDRYAPIDNLPILRMLGEALDGSDFKVVQSGKYYSRNDGVRRDDMNVRVMMANVQVPGDDAGDGNYGIGVLIRNGETGGCSAEVRPLIMRTRCENSITFQVGADGERAGRRFYHVGNAATKMILLRAEIAEALPLAAEGLDRFVAAQKQEIDLAATIARLADRHNWSQEWQMTISTGTEAHESIYGLANGLSYAAHTLDIDADNRHALETMAGALVWRNGA